MAIRRRTPLVRAKSDRRTVWFNFSVGATTLVASSQVLLASLNAQALGFRPFTIVRTRVLMQIESDQSAASEATNGAYGAIIVSDEAVAAGSASIPGPTSDTDAPWFVWQPWINSFLLGDGTGFVEPAGYTVVIDSKSMRKVGLNQDVAIMAQEAGGVGAIITARGRMLIKLH